jgi:hypothetical protein
MLVPDLLQTLIETLAALLKYRWLHGRWSIWTMPTSPHPERCQFQEAATLQAASNPVCTSNRITTWYPLSFPASHMSWITINIIHGTYSNMYMWIYAYIYIITIYYWASFYGKVGHLVARNLLEPPSNHLPVAKWLLPALPAFLAAAAWVAWARSWLGQPGGAVSGTHKTWKRRRHLLNSHFIII